jgi:diguanylate cyclase (GGDEF)-like protein/PAS domain S-box-containing protein
MVLDREGRIVLFNRACEQVSGHTSDEAVDQPVWTFLIPSDEVDQVESLTRTMLQGNRDNFGECHWIRKDGHQRLISWANTLLTEEDGAVRNIIATGLDITEQKKTEEKLQHLALHDPLTDLPNRALFQERLIHALALAQRQRHPLAILFLDLDRFKQVNDTLGHEVGDLLLVDVSRRLRGSLRKSDTVARLGGDEFAVLLPDIQPPELARQVAEKIIEQLTAPFQLQGHTCHIGTSIGISLYPDHALDAETLLKMADMAMYRVKKSGRNHYRYYDPEPS